MGKLSGKVALVTGAGRGIGLALAHKLSAEGASLVLNDLDEEPAQAAAASVRADGGRAIAVAGNVCRADLPQQLVDAAIREFGDLHIIVNNAGYIWNGPLHKISDEQWDAIQDVHLKAPFRILRAAYPEIKSRFEAERQAGRPVTRKVVNISSVSATRGSAGQSNYAAAKAGLFGLTKSLSKEWGPMNVTVNCVAFGFIETRLTQPIEGETAVLIDGEKRRVGLLPDSIEAARRQVPLRRLGTPEDGAGGVLLFCLPESDYISGQIIEVNGGMPG